MAPLLKLSGMRWGANGPAVLTLGGWDQSGHVDEAWALVAATYQKFYVPANIVDTIPSGRLRGRSGRAPRQNEVYILYSRVGSADPSTVYPSRAMTTRNSYPDSVTVLRTRPLERSGSRAIAEVSRKAFRRLSADASMEHRVEPHWTPLMAVPGSFSSASMIVISVSLAHEFRRGSCPTSSRSAAMAASVRSVRSWRSLSGHTGSGGMGFASIGAKAFR